MLWQCGLASSSQPMRLLRGHKLLRLLIWLLWWQVLGRMHLLLLLRRQRLLRLLRSGLWGVLLGRRQWRQRRVHADSLLRN